MQDREDFLAWSFIMLNTPHDNGMALHRLLLLPTTLMRGHMGLTLGFQFKHPASKERQVVLELNVPSEQPAPLSTLRVSRKSERMNRSSSVARVAACGALSPSRSVSPAVMIRDNTRETPGGAGPAAPLPTPPGYWLSCVTFNCGSAAIACSLNGSRTHRLAEYSAIWSKACGDC